MTSLHNALHGIKVIELANILAGPSVGMFCAELGAEVIKIENPRTGGDTTRSWSGATEKGNDISAYFSAVNWGKKSITLDLTTAQHRAICHDFCKEADIVIVSYKHGDAEKYGVDYKTISAINPRIIYGSITGFGHDNNRVGFDAVLQAMTGFMSMNGLPETPPIKMPVALIDIMAAHQLKQALLLALLQRSTTGKGTAVTVSLYGAAITALANQGTNYLIAQKTPQRLGSDHPNIAPYGHIFITKDKKEFLLAIGSDIQFKKLCAIVHSTLHEHNDFSTNGARVQNSAALYNALETIIAEWDADILEQQCIVADIPSAVIRTVAEALESPLAAPYILHDGTMRGIRTIAFQEQSGSDNKPPALQRPPHLGEHNAIIQKE